MLRYRLSSALPKSGITTTVAPSSRASSRFEALTLSTSSAPAATAVRISAASKLSTLTRWPSARSARTDFAELGKG